MMDYHRRGVPVPEEYFSHTYMWSVKDKLGQGATGQVFVGYNKKTGDKVAVKMFTRVSEYRAMQNEMEIIKKLNHHKNIVQFLEIDELEKSSGAHTIVMELCNGGSLYEVIDSPINAMGLDEFQFKRVVSDVAQGLVHLRKHGFVHRDIKPGNIMRSIQPDGSYIFKLADFGTARELGPNEKFTSLHGTEEYLYPAMYERALINPRSQKDFVDKVDLWSVGATFFHLATGQLPFQPYMKREDRATMYTIITGKQSGHILGWQRENRGPIFYSKELPPNINISLGLRYIITPVLAGLLDKFENMWEFRRFFGEIERITKMKVVDVFCVSKCTSHKIYLDPGQPNALQVLREKISQQTFLDPKHMEFYFGNIPFVPTEPIRTEHLPTTTPDTPITVFGGPPQKSDSLENPILTRAPSMPQDIAIIDDLRYSKECTKTAWGCYHSAEIIERYVRLMNQVALTLRETLNKEYMSWSRKLEEVKLMYKSFIDICENQITSLKTYINLLQVIDPSYNNVLSEDIQFLVNEVKVNEKFLQTMKDEQYNLHVQTDNFHSQISRIGNWDSNYCSEIFHGSMRTMKTYVDTIESLFKSFQEQKKTKGVPQSNYDKKVHEHNKKTIKKRLEDAEAKLRDMIDGRSRVYAKLYDFLRTYIPVREELFGFTESLNYCSQNLQYQSIPRHNQKMSEIITKLSSMADQRSGHPSYSNQQQTSSIDSSIISSIRELIQRMQNCSVKNNELVSEQSKVLELHSKAAVKKT